MSAGQDSEYRVGFSAADTFRHCVWDARGRFVDAYFSRSAAEYAARLLNQGIAHVDPHAVIGCKVVAA